MAKRFIDTDLFRKPLVRSLQAPYKVLWIYLLCECDHAGVWDVELDVAAMRLGVKLDQAKVLAAFGSTIVPIDGGRKWWLPEFVSFQYGKLKPENRVHASVIDILSKYGIDPVTGKIEGASEPLVSPLEGAKDMDMEQDKDTVIEKGERATAKPADPTLTHFTGSPFTSPEAIAAWDGFVAMRKRKGKPMTDRARDLIIADLRKMGEADAIVSLNASTRAGWTDVYPPKQSKSTAVDQRRATTADRDRPITIGQRTTTTP